ncbi:MAG: hypothetical protein KGJ13_01645 [Patescibacteria group bacterium]|nr:hypothetical protein [Patescibacteria group bacterium]
MIITALATITGILMSLGYYPQAWKIYKTRSAADISIPSFVIFSFGTASWFCYGVYLRDWTIMSSFGLGVIGSWTILFLSLAYKNKEKSA